MKKSIPNKKVNTYYKACGVPNVKGNCNSTFLWTKNYFSCWLSTSQLEATHPWISEILKFELFKFPPHPPPPPEGGGGKNRGQKCCRNNGPPYDHTGQSNDHTPGTYS